MVVIPTSLPWRDAYLGNYACFVKDLDGTWAIGTYDREGKEYIVDFQDKVVPSFFKSYLLAATVHENVDLIFNYLHYRGTPQAEDLTNTLRELFNTREERLCEPRDYLTIHWDDVPKADGWAPLASVEFADHTWGIVANLPEEDFLVLFDPGDPEIKTFHITQESADETVNRLFEQNEEVLERFETVSRAPKAKTLPVNPSDLKLVPSGRFSISLNPTVVADVETVLGIRDDWYNRRTGSGKHCLCHGCVSQAHAAIARIESHYAGPLDWELTQAIKEVHRWIPVR